MGGQTGVDKSLAWLPRYVRQEVQLVVKAHINETTLVPSACSVREMLSNCREALTLTAHLFHSTSRCTADLLILTRPFHFTTSVTFIGAT